MNTDEAARIARIYYGLDAEVTRCAGEKDDTFRVAAADGRRFILKATDPTSDSAEIDFQVEILDFVAAADADLPVPRTVGDRHGTRRFDYRDDAGQDRQIWMMSFLEGRPLSELSTTPPERMEIGKMLARLRLALAGFSHSAESRMIPWDVQHLTRLEGLLTNISDPVQRRQVEAGLARFADIESRLSETRRQVVHNDFTKSNLLANPTSSRFVSGVIDFGDAVRTSVAIDVATAMMNQLPREPGDEDLLADARDVLRGYLKIADLTEVELGLVPHLMMARVVARALLSITYSIRVPENAAYFLRNTEQGWHQLGWFLSRSETEISDQFLAHAA